MTLYLRAGLLAFVFCILPAANSLAGTVVLANRTNQPINYSIVEPDAPPSELTVQPGELATHSISGKAKLVFEAAGKSQEVELQVDSVYSFAAGSEAIRLEPVSIPRAGSPSRKPTDAPAKPNSNRPESNQSLLVISAKILVDEEEPAAQRIWEARIRNRLKAASDILGRYCHARIEVVAVGTWESDNNITDFHALLRDFEQKVRAEPNCVAIGFTSQLLAASGCAELGGTRGALHSHILIREWFGRTEPERLEVLLHELGHHLGAAHSADANSVMRSKLGDGKSVSKRFRIGFDPLNTLTMSMYAEAARDRNVKSLRDLESVTRVRLRDIYSEIAQSIPTDPVAAAYIARFSDPPPPPAPIASAKTPTEPPRDAPPVKSTTTPNPNPSTTPSPTPSPNPNPNPNPNPIKLTPRHAAIQQVLAAIIEAAEEARQSAASEPSLSGDALAELYFRRAAARAATLPREHAVPAFLLGIAIGLDTSDMLRSNDWTRQLWQTIEPDTQREHRLAVLGKPTIQTRHDLLQHFVVSCALTVLAGPQVSEAAGILKEMNDANGGSGFSFADLTADLAGITFATQLEAQPNRLPSLADSFKIDHHMPSIRGAREGLSREQLQTAYGSPSDPRFLAERSAIVERIQLLPGMSGKSSGRN